MFNLYFYINYKTEIICPNILIRIYIYPSDRPRPTVVSTTTPPLPELGDCGEFKTLQNYDI